MTYLAEPSRLMRFAPGVVLFRGKERHVKDVAASWNEKYGQNQEDKPVQEATGRLFFLPPAAWRRLGQLREAFIHAFDSTKQK